MQSRWRLTGEELESGANGNPNGGPEFTRTVKMQREDGEIRDGQDIRRALVSGESSND